ncbi:hypothetical protein SADUNF_Sadunf17G0108500 [Salix dunnii]|uniref:Uncharacterized protein n=1 Tax=Salix dunnii TaxID=1413687 RepID=A0A835MK84_9ROSI|nr:hypothetical protein SADUNF_Sadunf17G0108500 [Salix dunnii]
MTYKMQVPYELKKEQARLFHQLPSGLNVGVIEQEGLGDNDAAASPVAGSLQEAAFQDMRSDPKWSYLVFNLPGIKGRKLKMLESLH